MNCYYFLAEDFRCFKRRLDEIERMIRELSEKDGDPSRSVNDPYYENFFYTEHSKNQFKWSRRLLELVHIRDSARIISPEKRANVILPGKRAMYRIEGTGAVNTILVGSYFNFCQENAVPCSHPVARQFVGKKNGETHTATIQGETVRLSIVDMEIVYAID